MRQSTWLAVSWAGLTAAHGHLKSWTIDGTTYPAFDPLFDGGPEFNPKRIEYGFPKLKTDIGPGVNPVVDVSNLSIACRWRPLAEPQLTAVARAGSKVKFQWLDWFINHKGPVLTVRDISFADVHMLTFFSIWESFRHLAKLKK
jgi:cellulase